MVIVSKCRILYPQPKSKYYSSYWDKLPGEIQEKILAYVELSANEIEMNKIVVEVIEKDYRVKELEVRYAERSSEIRELNVQMNALRLTCKMLSIHIVYYQINERIVERSLISVEKSNIIVEIDSELDKWHILFKRQKVLVKIIRRDE